MSFACTEQGVIRHHFVHRTKGCGTGETMMSYTYTRVGASSLPAQCFVVLLQRKQLRCGIPQVLPKIGLGGPYKPIGTMSGIILCSVTKAVGLLGQQLTAKKKNHFRLSALP